MRLFQLVQGQPEAGQKVPEEQVHLRQVHLLQGLPGLVGGGPELVVSGLLLLVKGVLEIFGVVKVGTFLSGFLWVLGLIALIGMMAFSVVMTDRQKAREAAEEEAKKRGSSGSSRQTGSRMPEDAFSFGREEATAKTNEHTGDAK